MDCPFCGKEGKFTWNVSKNVGRCWTCEEVIKSKWYFEKVTSGSLISLIEFKDKVTKVCTKELSYLINAWDDPKAKLFLISRNVDEYLARKYNIKYSKEDNTLIVDITSISKNMQPSYLWRKLPKGKWLHKKGTKSIYYGFGWEKFVSSKKNVLICEGIFDLLSSRLIDKGIAILGSNLHENWYRWFKTNCNKLVLWFDTDEAGQAATLKISEKCLYYNIPFSVLRAHKDPKDFSRNSKADAEFLNYVEKEIDREQISFSRRYTFRR